MAMERAERALGDVHITSGQESLSPALQLSRQRLAVRRTGEGTRAGEGQPGPSSWAGHTPASLRMGGEG